MIKTLAFQRRASPTTSLHHTSPLLRVEDLRLSLQQLWILGGQHLVQLVQPPPR